MLVIILVFYVVFLFCFVLFGFVLCRFPNGAYVSELSILDWAFDFSYFDFWSLADCLSCDLKSTSYRLKFLNTSCLFIHVEFQASFPLRPIRVDSR